MLTGHAMRSLRGEEGGKKEGRSRGYKHPVPPGLRREN